MKKIVLPAKTEALYTALDFVTEAAAESGGVKEPMKLELITEEILVNIASYGYGESGGDVEIECGEENGLFILLFKDGGIPYNPLERTNPDLTETAQERPIGGLGVYLVKECADLAAYAYEDGKNILTVGIRLQRGE